MSEHTDHVHDRVDDLIHDLLGADEAARIEGHCADCAECGRALEAARRRLALLRSVPSSEATPRLIERTLGRVEEHERRRARLRKRAFWGAFGTLAASMLVLAGFHSYFANLAPTPYDLVVLGQEQLLAATHASLRIHLVNRHTRQAMAGVPVVIELHGEGRVQKLAEFTTDDHGNGSPAFEVPGWEAGRYQLRVVARTPGGEEGMTLGVTLRRARKVMLSSDKPVYQPGQTIKVRALALRVPDLKPVAGEAATFTVADPRGNVVFKHREPTSRYGIASTECPLAREILEGTYVIHCDISETESRLAVEVKKYVLPKFKLEVEPDEPFYQPGQQVKLKVKAKYFFGKPVAGAEVVVTPSAGNVEEGEWKPLKARTDDDGEAEVSFALPEKLVGTEKDSGDARVTFGVKVTDTAGQEQERSIDRRVTRRPVRIEAIPEGGTLVEGVANRVYVLTARADGKPLPTWLTVRADQRALRRGAGGELASTLPLRTDVNGVASFEVVPRTPEVRWVIRAHDADGKEVASRQDVLTCGRHSRDFLVRTDRAVYRAGQSMELTALGGGVEPVFVDLIRDGQTFLTETVEMKDGKGSLSFDIPPELFGTVLVCAYRFGEEGLPVRKERVVYVHPPGDVKVRTTLDQKEYRPGRRARLTIQLTDADGKPRPGAVSLAAVDEAVFSVLARRPGLEQTFYTVERELLEPIYTLYPWSPDAGQAPGEEDFERALFARTSKVEGQVSEMDRVRGVEMPNIAPSGPHTLAHNSLPEKAREVYRERRDGIRWVGWGWLISLGLVLLGGYLFLLTVLSPRAILNLHVFLLLVMTPLPFLLLPMFKMGSSVEFEGSSAVMVFEPSGRLLTAKARNDLRQSGMDLAGFPPALAPVFKRREGQPAFRIRELFPETMLWVPQKITDDEGKVSVEIDLADSITTWRLSASAVTADGRLGATQAPLKVFQPFFVDLNLPVALTRGDEVGIPVVVYNYLDGPQIVSLTVPNQDWFTALDPVQQKIELKAGEVRSLTFRIRVDRVGRHVLQAEAVGKGTADALRKPIEVVPDGQRVEHVVNGTLEQPANVVLTLPDDAIEGSGVAVVKVYPSSFSQLVEGLDNIFRMPYGCFEQTSSTTYPNVLALNYLRRMRKGVPHVEAKARQYINLGYQRLVGFEVPGGGFSWFGDAPANRTLTAYGLREFEDMAEVHDVDKALIERTRQWLLDQRSLDGSWEPEGHTLHEDVLRAEGRTEARLATTAYIAWAVFARGKAKEQASATREFLLSHRPGDIHSAHVLALVANALLAMDPGGKEVAGYLDRLETMKESDAERGHVWWALPARGRTTFYGSGLSGKVETTALAALALIGGKRHAGSARSALAWLAAQKDANGTWHSTQATVLALKALLAGSGTTLGDGKRKVRIRINGEALELLEIPADQAEVMRLVDVSGHLKPGANTLSIADEAKSGAGYQVAFRYHVPQKKGPAEEGPLSLNLTYSAKELRVRDLVRATARAANRTKAVLPMVMLDLPIPPGFAPLAEDLDKLVKEGTIARYQVRPRTILVYLKQLAPGAPVEVTYRLRATMPVQVSVPPGEVYEYYDPARRGRSTGARLTVTGR